METESVDTIPFLQGASARGRSRLLERTKVETHGAGAIVFREGDPPDFVYVIKRGLIEVVSLLQD